MGPMPAERDGNMRKDMGWEWDCESNPMQISATIPRPVANSQSWGS